jgi:hypothetical protein
MLRAWLLLAVCALCTPPRDCQALLLLRDLATPAMIIDVGFLSKQIQCETIPPLVLGQSLLMPTVLRETPCPPHGLADQTADPVDLLHKLGICYWHASVRRGRDDRTCTEDECFLAELDAPVALAASSHLVLGLNNHHVGSYYWARSVGGGAAMEAPGIAFRAGCLQWQETAGPTTCNSNDGKRSEWVNFLRPGDHVQLVPHKPTATIKEWLSDSSRKIYGVSSDQRPLGSEPAVVCEWSLG